jgi:hypothetical protein
MKNLIVRFMTEVLMLLGARKQSKAIPELAPQILLGSMIRLGRDSPSNYFVVSGIDIIRPDGTAHLKLT